MSTMSTTYDDRLDTRSFASPLSTWIERLVATDAGYGRTALRVTLGVVMFPHGAQKLLGWFGGYGFEGTMGYLTGMVGLPWLVALAVILIEFFGSLALIVGAFGRVAALGIGAIMIGAIVTTHLPMGFFMDWGGTMAGEGYEYHLLVLGMVAALAIGGSGALSVDRTLARR